MLLLINLMPKVKKPKLPQAKIALLVFFAIAITIFAVKFDPQAKSAAVSPRDLHVEEKEAVLFTLLSVGYRVPESRPQIEALTRRLVEEKSASAVDPLLPPEKLVVS